MISSAVVSRYANALVDVVLSSGSGITPDQALQQLRDFDGAVQSSADLRNVLASPAISITKKRLVIKDIAKVIGASDIIRNFVLVVNDHRRAAGLSAIVAAFENVAYARMGFIAAEVRSAYALTDHQQGEITTLLGNLSGARMRMRFEVDPDLIGGLSAKIGSKVYDGSIRGQLAEFRSRLAVNQ
ncbi:MAG TPA: ATP synthase F1 subunit delta [Bryobacteraceae bacterium]|jgi:F-type H+-transporting ATPase subunit delta|nr:ATP synthase F1 subunit delta [Bryobacteraceae bacterium]